MLPFEANRSVPLFREAIESLDPRMVGVSMPVFFSYWDTYETERPAPAISGPDCRVLSLAPKSAYMPLADKRKLGRAVRDHRLNHLAPATFESVEDALAYGNPGTSVWFIKNPHCTGGNKMSCVSSAGLPSTDLPDGYILQEGVRDPLLVDGKKCTARMYVLVWAGSVYLYQNGFLVVHGADYDPDSTDYSVQIDHSGYADSNSPVTLVELSELDRCDDYLLKIEELVSGIEPILRPVVEATDLDTYIPLGIDVMLQDDGGVQLIEINSIPNFTHTAEINKAVNVPMFRSMLETLLGRQPKAFKEVDLAK